MVEGRPWPFTRPIRLLEVVGVPSSGSRSMQLHFAPASPFARKVRVAVRELNLQADVVEVPTVVAPTQRNADYGQVNPLRLVPALVLADGRVLPDSTLIVQFLDDLAGGGRLVPSGGGKWSVLARHALAQGMLEAAVSVRYETAVRPAERRWEGWIEDRWSKIDDTLQVFERGAGELGGPFDMAQIGLACLLGYLDFRFAGRHWRDECPQLAAWFLEIAERPSMVETQPNA